MSYSLAVEKDVSIPLRGDGVVVADVFRPAEAGAFPVIMTLGPYPKCTSVGGIVPTATPRSS